MKFRCISQQSNAALSRSELLTLLAEAKKHSTRDWLAILVTFWHGLRASELIAIQAEDVSGGRLTVRRLKGSLTTIQQLITTRNPLLNERGALEELADNTVPGRPIFDFHRSTFWRIIQRHGRAVHLPAAKLHPHALKHSIAMQTIEKAGIENVRQHLGHKSISSTGAYLRVTDEQADKAIRRAIRA